MAVIQQTRIFRASACTLGVQRYARLRYDTYRDTEVTIRYDTIQNDTHTHHTVLNSQSLLIRD
jgi:hypothetical protein